MQKLWQKLSLQAKLFSALFSIAALTALILSFSLFNQIKNDYYELLRHELMSLASIAASQIDGDRLNALAIPEQEDSQEFLDIKQKLANFQASAHGIKYIYTLRRTEDPRYLAFIVDADYDAPAKLGELYDATSSPEMINAFYEPSADYQPITDKWGATLSGYAPVHDAQNKVIGIVGVDISADHILEELEEYRQQTIRYTIICLLIAAIISLLLAESLTRRLHKINLTIDQIASGNLNVTVKDDGKDEVAHLASKINNMAALLLNARENMLLSTIESLVGTLEAKDSYTYGHSSEVAATTFDICRELELPEADSFYINLAAILHDIGKVGVPDNILNKQGPLNDEEWLQIKQHPAIGAKIISGIPSLREVAEMVRFHHARWDGKGYPEPLKGPKIPLGARIIAVADSFQAMTSDRSYRRGMPEDLALAEIMRCSGTQFDPEVVAAFLKTRNFIG